MIHSRINKGILQIKNNTKKITIQIKRTIRFPSFLLTTDFQYTKKGVEKQGIFF